MTAEKVKRELAAVADPARAASSAWFFKTGKGQYGEGDHFIGITVPLQRRIALRYREMELDEVGRLLASPVHEHRFVALEVLVARYLARLKLSRSAICAASLGAGSSIVTELTNSSCSALSSSSIDRISPWRALTSRSRASTSGSDFSWPGKVRKSCPRSPASGGFAK